MIRESRDEGLAPLNELSIRLRIIRILMLWVSSLAGTLSVSTYVRIHDAKRTQVKEA